MKFTSQNDDNSVEKIEPQIVNVDEVRENTSSSEESNHQDSGSKQNQASSSLKETTMNSNTNNPILEFVKNLGETAQYIWDHYFAWVIHVSWSKMFLTCVLVLIAGSILSVHSIANWLVFGSLLLKCFVGKEDQVTPTKETENTKSEGS